MTNMYTITIIHVGVKIINKHVHTKAFWLISAWDATLRDGAHATTIDRERWRWPRRASERAVAGGGGSQRRRGSSSAQREKRKQPHREEEGKRRSANEDLASHHLGREGMRGAGGAGDGINPSSLWPGETRRGYGPNNRALFAHESACQHRLIVLTTDYRSHRPLIGLTYHLIVLSS